MLNSRSGPLFYFENTRELQSYIVTHGYQASFYTTEAFCTFLATDGTKKILFIQNNDPFTYHSSYVMCMFHLNGTIFTVF